MDPNRPINLKLDLEEVKLENLLTISPFRLALGSHKVGLTGNTIITTFGCITGGVSALNFQTTQNRAAKVFYGLSVVGGAAVLARTCQISETAMLSEGLAVAF